MAESSPDPQPTNALAGTQTDMLSHKSLWPDIVASSVLCIVLTTLFVAARIYTKVKMSAWSPEDC